MSKVVKEERAFHRGLTRPMVLAAALGLLDAHGREALSMRRLAAELDVKAPSLYVHVRSKDDLITGVLDTVLDEVVLPPIGASARESLIAGFTQYRLALVRHPGVVGLLAERAQPSPTQTLLVARSVELLEGAGLTTAAAVSAHVTLVAYTLGFVLQEVAVRPATPPPDPATLPAAFVRAISALTGVTVDDRFQSGLDTILDGLLIPAA